MYFIYYGIVSYYVNEIILLLPVMLLHKWKKVLHVITHNIITTGNPIYMIIAFFTYIGYIFILHLKTNEFDFLSWWFRGISKVLIFKKPSCVSQSYDNLFNFLTEILQFNFVTFSKITFSISSVNEYDLKPRSWTNHVFIYKIFYVNYQIFFLMTEKVFFFSFQTVKWVCQRWKFWLGCFSV